MIKNEKIRKSLRSGIGIWQIIMIFIAWLMVLPAIQVSQAGIPGGTMDDKLAFQTSISHLKDQASDFGIQNAQTEFRLNRIGRDTFGVNVRLDQTYKGIRVFGQQLIVHMESNGKLRSITGNYERGINVQVEPVLGIEKAKENTLKLFSIPAINTPELMLYPMNGKVVLVYYVVVEDMSVPRRIVAFVDARTGELVDSYDDLQTLLPSSESQAQVDSIQSTSSGELKSIVPVPSIGVGRSLYSGTVNISTVLAQDRYFMLDMTRGSGSQIAGYMRTSDMKNSTFGSGTLFPDLDNTWGNWLTTDRATAGVDAYFGAAMTWDYYLNTFGRKGIYNDSKGTLSKVHYGRKYDNAFWSDSCKCMTYGDGDGILFLPLVSIDVAGHEMTHGITAAMAGLIYTKQSGGLNEAMSDIFGTMIEFYASTHGATKNPNYLIGEDVYTPTVPGDALRYMDNPTKDNNSIDTFSKYYNGIDVHYSSGIANNAFYLLAEGGRHRLGGVVTGIGRDKAQRIFFRALDVYMVPSETFSQARADTIRAATDLYGASSQEVKSVGQAWSAVGV